MFENEDVEIDTREIEHSYCPGKFDLSIDGKKFAGISQRRVRGGIAVQIYLCVEGSGSERAEMMRVFYEHALKGEVTKFKYRIYNLNVWHHWKRCLGERLKSKM